MPAVTLVLPALNLGDVPALADRQREFPLLARCLGAATLSPRAGPLEAALLAHCGLARETSVATLTAAHDLGAVPHRDLLRSDPVYLHADPDKVLIYAPAALELTAEEADELLGALQREFPELGFCRGACPTRWYVERPQDVTGIAPSVQWLHGRSLTPFMPLAATERPWRRWLNDLQMVLHEQPVNQSRARRGLPAINGVWWFGAGGMPHAGRAAQRLIGNDVLLAGIAALTRMEWRARAAADRLPGRHAADLVLVAGAAFGAADAGEEISLAAIDTAWLPALVRALRIRRIARLCIETATHCAELGWWQSLKGWHRPLPFAVD